MDKADILIIDDEIQMQKLLEITLQSNQYRVSHAATAKEGMMTAASHQPDMILLDLGLPDEDGHKVLQRLREWYTNPVIILSVQSSEEDIVKALDNGANDYLVKPFRTRELLARIRSALRSSFSEENTPVLTCEDLQIDLSARTVKRKNEFIKLTATEYNLLSLFVRHEGKVLTHQYLLREVWGPGYINQSQYLRVFIAQLRKKIETDPNRPEMIITESGVGYRFVCKES
ncbi:MAG: response regulator transcription factor [Chitinophagaceae bacterium]|nr:response regulator transcription factor [Chitinophagaceae bacterium]